MCFVKLSTNCMMLIIVSHMVWKRIVGDDYCIFIIMASHASCVLDIGALVILVSGLISNIIVMSNISDGIDQ